MRNHLIWVAFIGMLMAALVWSPQSWAAESDNEEVTFTIRDFQIEGSTLIHPVRLKDEIRDLTGKGRTAQDVEEARSRVEAHYHDKGYPTVLVNIPEQSVEDGVIRLKVIESKIREVKVKGNTYFTGQMIKKNMPSLELGKVMYVPDVQRDLAKVNSISKDLEVTPMIVPGENLDTVDVTLKVKDKLPLHGSVSLSNRGTHDTTDLRVNVNLSYDNLWQRGHSVSLQYQTAPEKPEEVQVFGGSYVLPAPWNEEQVIALYALSTDSETAFGQGFETVGEGFILGGRYVLPLPPYERYSHNLTLGLDYKDFEESTELDAEETLDTPVTYLPLSISYNSNLPHGQGLTSFSLGLNMAFRHLVTDLEEFKDKRSGARGSYIYATLGVERHQRLPKETRLFAKIDGQIADQPLVSNEQYTAGGMESVRGYKESEESGDDAVHWTLELWNEKLSPAISFNEEKELKLEPYLFYDGVYLRTIDPLPGQDEGIDLHGAGLGLRGNCAGYLDFELALAAALAASERIEAGELEGHFNLSYEF